MKEAHPDHGGSSEKVAEVKAWYAKVTKQRESVILGNIKMDYITHPREDIWVGDSSVVYKTCVAGFNWQFADDKMKALIEPHLPKIAHDFNGYIAYRRQPGEILLADLLGHYPVLDSPHVCWIISRLLNLGCYLNWAGLSLCDIGPHNLLINLEKHWVSLTGPTPFLVEFNKRPQSAPGKTVQIVPSLRNKSTVASPMIDLMLIRNLGLELIGDPSGSRIKSPIMSWLISAPAKTAFEDFSNWGKALGERKFVKFPQTAQEIYNL